MLYLCVGGPISSDLVVIFVIMLWFDFFGGVFACPFVVFQLLMDVSSCCSVV